MAIISWGKPRIFIKPVNSDAETKWSEVPTPAEGTTQLNTTKGNKTEAKIEGGENEAVRYAKSTYALTFNIRKAAGRKPIVDDEDGIVIEPYSVMLQPENPVAPGLLIDESTASVEDTYTAADGAAWVHTFDALKPADNTRQVKWGTVTVGADGQPSFTETKFE